MTLATAGSRIATVSKEAPWRWLALGWHDTWRRPLLSLGYGAAFTLIGLLITAGAWWMNWSALIPVAAGGFILIGPIMAVGLYEMSRRYALHQSFRVRDIALVRAASRVQLFYFGFGLLFLFLVWLRIATLLFALFVSDTYPDLTNFLSFALTTANGLALLIVGTIIGGVIAFFAFAISAISAPMLMDRQVDFMTAIFASIEAVRKNPWPMVLWAWLIAALLSFGLATMFLGLVVVFPLVGHATWHAYKELVPSGGSA
jgi:uncharacterized membrane protein